jgi:hypothetical protein
MFVELANHLLMSSVGAACQQENDIHYVVRITAGNMPLLTELERIPSYYSTNIPLLRANVEAYVVYRSMRTKSDIKASRIVLLCE